VVEHVLVEQVGLVEEEDGMEALAAEIFDVEEMAKKTAAAAADGVRPSARQSWR
jgi:hypothetical protein